MWEYENKLLVCNRRLSHLNASTRLRVKLSGALFAIECAVKESSSWTDEMHFQINATNDPEELNGKWGKAKERLSLARKRFTSLT